MASIFNVVEKVDWPDIREMLEGFSIDNEGPRTGFNAKETARDLLGGYYASMTRPLRQGWPTPITLQFNVKTIILQQSVATLTLDAST